VLLENPYSCDLNGFSFTFFELPKFTKSLHDLETMEERWLYFLKEGDKTNHIPQQLIGYPSIAEAYELIERFSWSEEELYFYEKSLMNISDWQAMLDGARDRGFKQGLEEAQRQARKISSQTIHLSSS